MDLAFLRRLVGVELIEVSAAERAIAALGGGLSIFLLHAITGAALGGGAGTVPVVASMGASAVLLFAVPHGQLSQPWPVLAGHLVSALIGVSCAATLGPTPTAAACAVGLAIFAMHTLKCIHPPGGATAWTAVLGGAAIRDLGFSFVLLPVAANAAVMVALAVALNAAFRWRRYPAALGVAPARSPQPRVAAAPATHEEIVAALKTIDSFVDVSEEELLRLTELLRRGNGAA